MSSKILYDQCKVCGSEAINKVTACRDYTVSQEYFEVWKCSNCTFCFTQNTPGEGEIARYYQSADYISHSDTKEGIVNQLYHIARRITLKKKRSLIEKVTGTSKGSLLDIGAGTGAFAHTMQQAGWLVTGLEPDETARVNALRNYNLELLQLTALATLPAETFDAITLWHVLEHVHDLQAYISKFSTLLKPNGRLLVAVPNYTSYDACFYKEFWAAYDVPRHLYHFSPQSMQVLLAKYGFKVGAYKPMWFDSFYISMLSEKYKHGKNRYLHAAWTGLVSNAKALLNVKKCSSVIYVIQKK